MKKIINYVLPRPFNGFNIPIAIQSTYLRDYCKKKKYIFSLPVTEFTKTNSFAMLSSLICAKKASNFAFVSGFVFPVYDLKKFRKLLKNGYIKFSDIKEIRIIKKVLPHDYFQNFGGGESSLRLSDGTFRKLVLAKLPTEAADLTSLNSINQFGVKPNWFFEELINPLLFVSFDITGQAPIDTERAIVKRFILNIVGSTINVKPQNFSAASYPYILLYQKISLAFNLNKK